jgi:hypothetical protein
MVMLRVVSLAPDDEHKVFHLAEIVNGQRNCVINWRFLIITGTNRLLTSIMNGWKN